MGVVVVEWDIRTHTRTRINVCMYVHMYALYVFLFSIIVLIILFSFDYAATETKNYLRYQQLSLCKESVRIHSSLQWFIDCYPTSKEQPSVLGAYRF